MVILFPFSSNIWNQIPNSSSKKAPTLFFRETNNTKLFFRSMMVSSNGRKFALFNLTKANVNNMAFSNLTLSESVSSINPKFISDPNRTAMYEQAVLDIGRSIFSQENMAYLHCLKDVKAQKQLLNTSIATSIKNSNTEYHTCMHIIESIFPHFVERKDQILSALKINVSHIRPVSLQPNGDFAGIINNPVKFNDLIAYKIELYRRIAISAKNIELKGKLDNLGHYLQFSEDPFAQKLCFMQEEQVQIMCYIVENGLNCWLNPEFYVIQPAWKDPLLQSKVLTNYQSSYTNPFENYNTRKYLIFSILKKHGEKDVLINMWLSKNTAFNSQIADLLTSDILINF
jgi:hypothetical protein